MQKKRVVKRKNSMFKNIILLFMLILTVFFTVNSVNEIMQIFTLRASIAEALKEQEELEEKKTDLQEEKANLENPEYLLRYARGKYLVTKDDGEQVFKLPEEEEE